MANFKDAPASHAARSARKRAKKLGLADAVLTVALCADEKTGKCATACEMRQSWKSLRELAKQRRRQHGQRLVILRIDCPGICKFGPIVGVFPGQAWYGGCDPETLERIVECHLPTHPPDPLAAKDALQDRRICD